MAAIYHGSQDSVYVINGELIGKIVVGKSMLISIMEQPLLLA
ncbi:hypothetical protein [Coxiella endosymbiont of Ornithodoros amblus]|nr:hypothetical protein [Coxiella endosymbiont of Ornithodoros amblus]